MNTALFVEESNRIEGIVRLPTAQEIAEHDRFMALDVITIDELKQFVSIYQPGTELRDKQGMDVRFGSHIPPRGGTNIVNQLQGLLDILDELSPYRTHCVYETLHPFMDCNGRSGRAIWAWQMRQKYGNYDLGFLHHFYYQALDASRLMMRY